MCLCIQAVVKVSGVFKLFFLPMIKMSSHDRSRNSVLKLEKFRFREAMGRIWFFKRVVDE